MAMPVREQETPYRSLLAAVHLLEDRQKSLSAVIARSRAATGGEEWGPTTLVPYVEAEHDRLCEVAATILKPHGFEDVTGNSCFKVCL